VHADDTTGDVRCQRDEVGLHVRVASIGEDRCRNLVRHKETEDYRYRDADSSPTCHVIGSRRCWPATMHMQIPPDSELSLSYIDVRSSDHVQQADITQGT